MERGTPVVKVFKFGGASVRDAAAVRNVAEIIRRYPDDSLVVIVSAMGKITNALEALLNAYVDNTDERWQRFFQQTAATGGNPADLDYRKGYTLRFVNQRVGMGG